MTPIKNNKIIRFVIWICAHFLKDEIGQIVRELQDILDNRNPEIKPKDDFRQNHPNYRDFNVDPLPPLTEAPDSEPTRNYKEILADYIREHGKPSEPVRHRSDSLMVPETCICPNCSAPHTFLYFNDGKKKSQIKCKVCNNLFQINKKKKNKKTKYYCPHCHKALYKWKESEEVTIYKCPSRKCPKRLEALNNLNPEEQSLQETKSSQFKITYQYREYHFDSKELRHSSPIRPRIDLSKIYNSQNVLGLILSFYVSFGVSARKTSLILKQVFNISVSYQTVLNYAEAAAHYCHQFNSENKGPIDNINAGDETYIKIMGKHAYVFFFISTKSLKITAYHVADNRGVQPAIVAMNEAARTAEPGQTITFVTDGNPSYPAGIHFINADRDNQPDHQKVIGLQNLDNESEEFRPFKQIIERLNRTFKNHVRPAHGFNTANGAIVLTTLFVTHYNFLRPHMTLDYKTPIQIKELDSLPTIQSRWAKILAL